MLLSTVAEQDPTRLALEGEAGADAVGGGGLLRSCRALAELLGVESDTESSLDTWTQALSVAKHEDSRSVKLGLDKGSTVQVGLHTNLKRDIRGGCFGVVNGLQKDRVSMYGRLRCFILPWHRLQHLS